MKKLTLDQTWEQCLKMWKWISRQCKGKSKRWCGNNTNKLKHLWLKKHKFDSVDICQACFFCDYTTVKLEDSYDCRKCPGKKVDSEFCCRHNDVSDWNSEVFFRHYPRLFYAKLKELNKIRLERKNK